jgi:hypothetical protein
MGGERRLSLECKYARINRRPERLVKKKKAKFTTHPHITFAAYHSRYFERFEVTHILHEAVVVPEADNYSGYANEKRLCPKLDELVSLKFLGG